MAEKTSVQKIMVAPVNVEEFIRSGDNCAKLEFLYELRKKMQRAPDSEAKQIYFDYFKNIS